MTNRHCPQCDRNRSEKFWSARGKVCTTCAKTNRRATARRNHLLKTYRMTPEQADAILSYHGGGCAICAGVRPYALHLDHDHAKPDGPESWRGFLCKAHNKLLRDVRDDVTILLAAADYLQHPPAQEWLKSQS